MVKVGEKQTCHVLAVVPGNTRLDLQAVKALLDGTYVAFAGKDKAEELAGTVLPFSYHPRLDRSIALATADYVRLAEPRIAPISTTT
jgi:Ala-tRNA(Pro) deacylase